jgi:hypothetical protein
MSLLAFGFVLLVGALSFGAVGLTVRRHRKRPLPKTSAVPQTGRNEA